MKSNGKKWKAFLIQALLMIKIIVFISFLNMDFLVSFML